MIALTAGLLSGCGAERAEFSNREQLDELAPEVQKHIRSTLKTHFGSPVDMVAWERLPLQYHYALGSFGEAPAQDGNVSTLPVTISTVNRSIEPEQDLTWLSGVYIGQPGATVDSYDEAQGTLTIAEQLAQAPGTGDRFAIGAGKILEEGRVLYAEHCQHCHGVSGDGNGPTAKYLNPRPRDYRLGKFKFTSTNTSDRASRDDLKTTIWEGIPGTYMPSFKLLTDDEMQSIVEYVLWLSMRGEIEYRQVQLFKNDYSKEAVKAAVADARASDEGLSENDARQQVIDELKEYLEGDWQDEFNDDTKFLADQWRAGQEESAAVIPKEPMPGWAYNSPEAEASRQRGRALFLSPKAKCATCHGDQGRGDGGQTLSVQKNPTTNAEYALPGLYDDWGNPLIPRNLTSGIYRGGRRPIDLYRRIYAGIKGTPMPAFGTVLKDPEIWDIVNYVTSIPFEAGKQKPGEGARESLPAPAEVAAREPSTESGNIPSR